MTSDLKWPATHPDWIQLYTLGTPNGQKVSVALEEMELPYDTHRIDIMEGDQFSEEFIRVNPNSKIPAILDPKGPDGSAHAVFESGAILLYVAEKSGRFIPKDAIARSECLQWLFFQMGGVGPMFGQYGHFYRYAKEKHPYSIERYENETKRLLAVLETRLNTEKYLAGGEYSIADMATFPWVSCIDWAYEARDHLKLDANYPGVVAWHDRCAERPATARGLKVAGF